MGEKADTQKVLLALKEKLSEGGIKTRSVIRKGEFFAEEPYARMPGSIEAEVLRKADDIYIVSSVLGIPPDQLDLAHTGDHRHALVELRKAMDTTTTTAGGDWCPTGFSKELIDAMMLLLKVAALHKRITMPTDPYRIPRKRARSIARLGSENAAVVTATQPTTDYANLDAIKLISYVPASYELEEDSIVPLLPIIKDDLVTMLAMAQEQATIDGDLTAQHQDDTSLNNLVLADDCRHAWAGYRILTLATAKVDFAGAVTSASLRAIRKAIGKYGADPNSLAWIVGVSDYNQMMGLGEVLTVDKYGPNAVVLKGELGKFDGIPVILSEYVREDLNALGVYDGAVVTKTIVLLVRRDGWLYGDRRSVTLEVDKDIKAQTIDLVATQRVAFSARYYATTEKIVGLGRNITS